METTPEEDMRRLIRYGLRRESKTVGEKGVSKEKGAHLHDLSAVSIS